MRSVLDTTARHLGAEFIPGNRNALVNAQRWDLADKGEPSVPGVTIPEPQCCEQKKQSLGEDPATAVKVTTSLLWSKSPLQLASLADAF